MCDCEKCRVCDGSGEVWVSFDGGFVGPHHLDDLDSLEPCPACDGSGYDYICPECEDAYRKGETL